MTEQKQRLERNELNQNSFGGSESVAEAVLERLPEELTSKFQFISSRVRDLKEDKIRVYWVHDTPFDKETAHLKDESSRNRFHKIVFCSNWQFQQFVNFLGVPYDQRNIVIDTPVVPIENIKKSKKEIRLAYTSTPQRGLEILVPVFEKLCEKYDNITLDVFSSFKIYGWEANDQPFEQLFERCRNHPKINYHGFQPNETVRKSLAKSHILAYPSIWQECNSRSLIEAMSAKMLCVHPNFAGLTDTAAGLTTQYQFDANHNVHAQIFYAVLDEAIQIVQKEDTENYLNFVKAYADTRFNIGKIVNQWEMLLNGLAQQYKAADLTLPKKDDSYFVFNTEKR